MRLSIKLRKQEPLNDPVAAMRGAASGSRMRAMAAGAGKNFRTDDLGTAMVVRHIVFRLGFSRKHHPGPFRAC